MNFVQLTLKGVSPELTSCGALKISRMVQERPSTLIRPDSYSRPWELAAFIPADGWNGSAWFPTGAKDETAEFFTWVINVREDLVELVKASCQPRVLFEEGKDVQKLTPEVRELMTASGLVITDKLP